MDVRVMCVTVSGETPSRSTDYTYLAALPTSLHRQRCRIRRLELHLRHRRTMVRDTRSATRRSTAITRGSVAKSLGEKNMD